MTVNMGPNERIGCESTDLYTRKGRFPSQFLNKKIEIDSIHSHRFSVMNIPFDETGSRVDEGLWKVVG